MLLSVCKFSRVRRCLGLTAIFQKTISPSKDQNWGQDVRNRFLEFNSPFVIHWFISIPHPPTHTLQIQCQEQCYCVVLGCSHSRGLKLSEASDGFYNGGHQQSYHQKQGDPCIHVHSGTGSLIAGLRLKLCQHWHPFWSQTTEYCIASPFKGQT